MTTTPLLTTAQAAELLGIKPSTLRLWRHLHKGPAYIRMGAGKFARAAYSPDEVSRWIAEHTVAPAIDEAAKK